MKILKPVCSMEAPNIKDALWIQPTKDGLEVKALDNGQWKAATIKVENKVENKVDLTALKKELLRILQHRSLFLHLHQSILWS